MFKGIMDTGDKALAPSSGILSSDFVEHDGNEALEEIEEENTIGNVHMSSQVGSDENNESSRIQSEPIEHMQQKRKSTDVGTFHFKCGKRKSLKQVGGAAKLSIQIDKLCSAVDNMSHATSRFTPIMDPFGIQHAIKILNELSEEVPKASELYFFFALNLMVNKEK
ncbi:hypothetical protein V6N12_042473 [Hibiscus sabdariffa]|uniref:Uncharacterized protein n=1 Tax=Hibiscus sabdariffa TaxID=183260 RepID=A0ABR2EEV8_9ROSI